MRAHPESIGHYTPAAHAQLIEPVTAAAPAVLFVVPAVDRSLYSGNQHVRLYAHTGSDALKLIASSRPRLVVIDCDEPSLGVEEVAAAAHACSYASVLITTGDVAKVPTMLKAGCEGVLLKPFAPNLLAARIGRVLKETERPWTQRAASSRPQAGTNRVWADTVCPTCGAAGATSFDFSSYRRMWYACLSCAATWLGPRQE